MDVHSHVFPKAGLAFAGTGKPWFGSLVERDAAGAPVSITDGRRVVYGSAEHFEAYGRRVERMDALGVDLQFLSVMPPLFRYGLEFGLARDAARAINDELGETAQQWPTRFRALATLPMADSDAAIAELDRVAAHAAFVGIQIGTHVLGRNLDDPRVEPVLAAASARGLFVLVHPSEPRGADAMTRFYLGNLVGNPFETTVAAGSLVFGGVLSRLPNLLICLAHGGGYAAFGLARFAHAWREREDLKALLAEQPERLLRRCYVDTVVHDARTLRFVIDVFGARHVLLGTDFPADMGIHDPVSAIDSVANLAPEERAGILGGNVRQALAAHGHLLPSPEQGHAP